MEGKEIDDWPIDSFGKAMGPALREAGVIMPYSRAQVFTRGWEGKYQAHHLLEVKMMKDLDIPGAENAPAVILTEVDHQVLTQALNNARDNILKGTGRTVPNKQELWAIYEKVYAGKPAWLEAIKSYLH